MKMSRWTPPQITALKGRERFACLTAYDYTTARVVDAADIPLILVGDSLAMTMLGHSSTLPVTMDAMLLHVGAVRRGAQKALVVADMPFMSYQVSFAQGLENAGRFLKEADAGAVKIEGGSGRVKLVQTLVENGIPVLAHIGLTPQNVNVLGGYKVQGRQAEAAQQLLEDAQALEKAGAFAIVLECMPAELGAAITKAVSIPTIGIGAGLECDGQILVIHDLLGLSGEATPRFAKRYANLETTIKQACVAFREDVIQQRFPESQHSYK